MENVLLVVHLIIAVAMILLILIQRNAQDGGGLLGGSSSFGGMFTARGGANVLTRTTSILAATFIITSLLLTVIASQRVKHSKELTNTIQPLQAEKIILDPATGAPDIKVLPNLMPALDPNKPVTPDKPAIPLVPEPQVPSPEGKAPAVPMAQ